jgi:hypothetical protein
MSSRSVPFVLVKADIISSRSGEVFEIANTITDFEVFEHIDKPYLTGLVSWVDTGGFLERINPTGSDILQIELSDSNDNTISVIDRKFVLSKMISLSKTENGENLISFHLIELHGWIDKLINANKSVTGTRREMIKTIVTEFLPSSKVGRFGSNDFVPLEIKYGVEEYIDQNRQFIIPSNMTPLEACQALKDEDSTLDGYPYFLYSALNNPGVKYVSLKEILDDNRSHATFSFGMKGQDSPYMIAGWKFNKTYDFLNLAKLGSMGADYMYYDPNLGLNNQFNYDFGAETVDYMIPDNLSEIPTVRKFNYTPRYTFDNMLSIQDQATSFKSHPYSNSLRNLLASNSMEISIEEARLFLGVNSNTRFNNPTSPDEESESYKSLTLGKKINLRYISSIQSETPVEDTSVGGSYFIYASRFIFKRLVGSAISGTVMLTCSRVFDNTSADTTIDRSDTTSRINQNIYNTRPNIRQPKSDRTNVR